MGERSAIGWTDATWNPWRGCDKVSPGCAHCYMFRDQRRYGKDPSVVMRAADATFYSPLKWREPRKVFTCSWSDWFHEDADQWRDEAWDIIRQTPRHTYQVLTKRPERIADHLPADWGEGYPNVWMGVSIENRRFVDRADKLREVPAAIRFISAEPLLGPLEGLDLSEIDWLIAGGESGPNHRPINPGWVRDLRDECLGECLCCARCPVGECEQIESGQLDPSRTAFFFKQWGGPRPDSNGRLLDGRTWDEMPTPRRGPRSPEGQQDLLDPRNPPPKEAALSGCRET